MKRQPNITDEDRARQIAGRFGEELEGWQPPQRSHEPPPRQQSSTFKPPRRQKEKKAHAR